MCARHILRILNNTQYAGVLTFAALANVLSRPITSVYPKANDADEYFNILNTIFYPHTKDSDTQSPIRILWSGPPPDVDHDWCANHFIPILVTDESNVPVTTADVNRPTYDNVSATKDAYITPTRMRSRSAASEIRIEEENTINEENDENSLSNINIATRRTFLEAPLII